MTEARPHLIVTEQDCRRLMTLIKSRGEIATESLEDELARAIIVPRASVPSDVVTMNSAVVFRDEETGEERQVALVYPENANPAQGRISVLAPLGCALLGLKEGQSIEWPLPGGRKRHVRVLSVSFQPEALGAFDL